MTKQVLTGLVGWRGMVGSVLLERMRAEGDFDLIEPVFFSTSNAGGAAPADAKNETKLFDAYSRIGGTGEFVDVGRVGADGHALFTHFPGIWQPRVASFLDRHGLRAARTGRGSKS